MISPQHDCAHFPLDRVGRPLLAFVFVDFAGWGKSKKLMQIEQFSEVEEIHSVAGDSSLLVKVRTGGAHAFEFVLAKLYENSGVQRTRGYIFHSVFQEIGIQANATENWEVELLPE